MSNKRSAAPPAANLLPVASLEVASGAASADTIAGYVREARQFRAWRDGHGLTVRDVSRDTVTVYRGALVPRGLAPATIADKLAVVRGLLREA